MLPEPGSNVFYELIRLWLDDCDVKHAGCKPLPRVSTDEESPQGFPTRLIDVGTRDNFQLRLLETKEEIPGTRKYIALSHPWGNVKMYQPFSTWRSDTTGQGHDIESFKHAIPYEKLPATFKDAVDCTRALDVRYLWIDSICIIQGRDGDFNEEAENMEKVFSGAYCVLAASRAAHQHDGFLKPRSQRNFVTFQRVKGKPFYVCEPIDDFSKDVIEGSLNQRGWVLQERALARRTIYFTENQTYFECGNGIRCETLASMRNTMADFIGDPRFPEKAMRANSRALQIAYYQDLYKLYSRLQFSRDEDRPFAIAGLEKRLRQAFGTKGGFGVFDDGDKLERGLFHRSILWRRGDEKEFENGLEQIDFLKRGLQVPSWSWMAYKGGIDYTTPEGGTAEWETDDIAEPWTRGFRSATTSAPQDGVIAIPAVVRNFRVGNRRPDDVRLYYDAGKTKGSDGQRAQCVVVAKDKRIRFEGLKRHYVLLVTPKIADSGRGRKVYERVGAGYMLGKHINFGEPGIEAEIR
ncbi:hypothetical protein SLS59_007728 [Nothophoma quercina]|uniref:Heterokaryon incompatibility domain-containing protein n=1 Tax=Nothophoma quercina TaxID=749835 RepID=A0ABR3QXF7_9PLEO